MKRSRFMSVSVFSLVVSFSLPVFADPPGRKTYDVHQRQMDQEREHSNRNVERERENRKPREEMRQEDRRGNDKMGGKYSNHRPDYHKYSGYRERPYERHRQYSHYVYKGHRYVYQGHWRSWDQWDRYAKRYKSMYKYGRYYREGAHLMFRYCDPETGSCIFFSIGR